MTQGLKEKIESLEHLMEDYAGEDMCLAFSGGVDSSLLLKAAVQAAKKKESHVLAVTFDTRLHPSCDLENAKQVAAELGGFHEVISVDELEQEDIKNNPVDRCYLCKKHLFGILRGLAQKRGISVVMDGTNEDDLHVYRPGLKALKELGIVSPLALLHFTKEEVKEAAGYYGISVSSRPSTPCMATRLPYGTPIDYEVLTRIEKGEEYLKKRLGGNVRLRLHGETARIEVDQQKLSAAVKLSEEITEYLRKLGFLYITLDLEGFRSGSMDVGLNL